MSAVFAVLSLSFPWSDDGEARKTKLTERTRLCQASMFVPTAQNPNRKSILSGSERWTNKADALDIWPACSCFT